MRWQINSQQHQQSNIGLITFERVIMKTTESKRMTRLQVAQFFERQNLNLECEKHIKAAHALMSEFQMNPPEINTIKAYKRSASIQKNQIQQAA